MRLGLQLNSFDWGGGPERFEVLEETLRIALRMWSGERGDERPFEGGHYSLGRPLNLPQSPSRPHLSIMVAGAAEMLGAAGIDCRVENEAGGLPNAIDVVLAWAVREGTTNVIRHSRAKNCRIVLDRKDGEAHAEITDDGWGRPTEEPPEAGSQGSPNASPASATGGSRRGPYRGRVPVARQPPPRKDRNR